MKNHFFFLTYLFSIKNHNTRIVQRRIKSNTYDSPTVPIFSIISMESHMFIRELTGAEHIPIFIYLRCDAYTFGVDRIEVCVVFNFRRNLVTRRALGNAITGAASNCLRWVRSFYNVTTQIGTNSFNAPG